MVGEAAVDGLSHEVHLLIDLLWTQQVVSIKLHLSTPDDSQTTNDYAVNSNNHN